MWLHCMRGLTCVNNGAHGGGGPKKNPGSWGGGVGMGWGGVGNKTPVSADEKGEQACVRTVLHMII